MQAQVIPSEEVEYSEEFSKDIQRILGRKDFLHNSLARLYQTRRDSQEAQSEAESLLKNERYLYRLCKCHATKKLVDFIDRAQNEDKIEREKVEEFYTFWDKISWVTDAAKVVYAKKNFGARVWTDVTYNYNFGNHNKHLITADYYTGLRNSGEITSDIGEFFDSTVKATDEIRKNIPENSLENDEWSHFQDFKNDVDILYDNILDDKINEQKAILQILLSEVGENNLSQEARNSLMQSLKIPNKDQINKENICQIYKKSVEHGVILLENRVQKVETRLHRAEGILEECRGKLLKSGNTSTEGALLHTVQPDVDSIEQQVGRIGNSIRDLKKRTNQIQSDTEQFDYNEINSRNIFGKLCRELYQEHQKFVNIEERISEIEGRTEELIQNITELEDTELNMNDCINKLDKIILSAIDDATTLYSEHDRLFSNGIGGPEDLKEISEIQDGYDDLTESYSFIDEILSSLEENYNNLDEESDYKELKDNHERLSSLIVDLGVDIEQIQEELTTSERATLQSHKSANEREEIDKRYICDQEHPFDRAVEINFDVFCSQIGSAIDADSLSSHGKAIFLFMEKVYFYQSELNPIDFQVYYIGHRVSGSENRVSLGHLANELETILDKRGGDKSNIPSKEESIHEYIRRIIDELSSIGLTCWVDKDKKNEIGIRSIDQVVV